MAVSGDFVGLALLRDRIRQIANGGGYKAVVGALRDEVQKQIVDCFREERDPYGKPWPPRKKPSAIYALRYNFYDDGHSLLDKTGKLIGSITSKAIAIGVLVAMAGYAVYHWQPDRSGEKLPQRAMLPTARQGLGPIWGDAFLKVSSRVARALMGGT